MRARYLLCEGEGGIYVVDQHAASERALLHRVRTEALRATPLTNTEPLAVRRDEASAFATHEAALGALGIEVRVVAPGAVVCAALPVSFSRSPRALVAALATELQRITRFDEAARDRVLALLACHAASQHGEAMQRGEAEAILATLDDADFGVACLHGRPVLYRLSFEEIERRGGV